MVICFVALPVAAVMSVVSVKYRPLAKEAFDCVFRKLTLRKCNTGLDVRLKSSITSAFLKANRPVGKFIHKYFEPISWLFVILTLTSGIGTIYGGYNFYLYGNCNGPQDSGFCIFDPTGHNEKTTDVAGCSENEAKHMQKDLIFSNFDDSTLPKLNRDAKTTVVMIACYDCDYSRESKQTIDKLIQDNNVNFVFAHFPVKNSSNIASRYGYCINQTSNDNFWKFNDKMFVSKKNLTEFEIQDIVKEIGLDPMNIMACANSETTKSIIEKQEAMIKSVGIYGTPTIFINGKSVVGPKPLRVYERMI